jgi:collagen beta-1,O-galactosyltransferase
MYSLKTLLLYFIIPILSKADEVSSVNVVTEPERFLPTVVIAVFVRNKAHTLPFFLTALEELEYPKDRIALW